MGDFAMPAGLGRVTPPSPAAGLQINSPDQVTFDYIIGKAILGGTQFGDTLGRFYPVVIQSSGGITINTSSSLTAAALTFHNTAFVNPDIIEYVSTDAVNNPLFVFRPSNAAAVTWTALFADRFGSAYIGLLLYPNTTTIAATGAAGVGNLNLDLRAQNAGSIVLGAQLANYIGVTGAAASANPGITVFGSDTNVSLDLRGKGTGQILLGANQAEYLSASGAASGSQPNIQAFGTDTNIDILLQTKGSGVLALGYSFTTLGGGAAPTFGTIGGSGPTTAGQAAWVKIKSGTTSYWVPVWT